MLTAVSLEYQQSNSWNDAGVNRHGTSYSGDHVIRAILAADREHGVQPISLAHCITAAAALTTFFDIISAIFEIHSLGRDILL